jgi:Ni/Fe-hydrogenase subunit HybB-like protein
MSPEAEAVPAKRPPLVEGDHDLSSLTDLVCGLVERPARPWWWIAMAISGMLAAIGGFTTIYVISTGLGIWGVNQTVGWGFPIATFVFWIGIGHAGTLISAILYLFRQRWRSSLNRAAEAMTLFAVVCAGFYVLIHLGRVWISWFMVPAPSANAIYPNYRSALSWDFAAIATYGTVSLLFWYVGLIPDLATVRDRARGRLRRQVFGLFALGWRGSARHWHNYEMAYVMLAALATPLVVSVHTIVSFDFATSVIPGWHTTIFPPYFVTGAIFSGLAMVITLMVPLRALCGLKDVITVGHLEKMSKLIIGTSLLIGYAYAVELCAAWYGGNRFEQYAFRNRVIGPYGWCYATMVACNVVVPQLFWFRWFRTTPWVLFLISVFINIGMWFERFVIVATSLHRDYLPSSWKMFYPTWVDYLQLLGGFGLFSVLFLLFLRYLPMIALSEVKACLPAVAVRSAGGGDDRSPAGAMSSSVGTIAALRRSTNLYGVLARFNGPEALLRTAGRLYNEGYRRLDAYSPLPIHGMDRALGLKRSKVPVLVLLGGIFGAVFAQTLQWYQSAVAYPLVTGGKPLNSAIAFVPITFETTILYAAFGAVIGLLALDGLPRLDHPVFRGKSFARVSDDGFFLSVEARDPLFDRRETVVRIEALGGTEVELIDI